jgi:GTPase SAR1 family protein
LLIGNKSDQEDKREVTYAEGAALAERKGMMFYECSARNGENVNTSFTEMTKKLIKKK